jgi:hypothetical protein
MNSIQWQELKKGNTKDEQNESRQTPRDRDSSTVESIHPFHNHRPSEGETVGKNIRRPREDTVVHLDYGWLGIVMLL